MLRTAGLYPPDEGSTPRFNAQVSQNAGGLSMVSQRWLTSHAPPRPLHPYPFTGGWGVATIRLALEGCGGLWMQVQSFVGEDQAKIESEVP
jgi:hypothetical protein